jgi:CelD/BcsL family acetyltransferase involved in cellulose biosynthesis
MTMPLMFQRAMARPFPLPRRAPRRGTFALEPFDALPRLSERISRLAERAVEANPFFLPDFLEPAVQALGRRGLKLAVFSDREDLRFFAPVLATRGRLTGRPKLSVWTHPFAPLGSPLIDATMADVAADGLLDHMRGSGRRLLRMPDMPLKGRAAKVLTAAAQRSGFWIEAGRQMRPVLHADAPEGMAAFDRMVPVKRRRELDRQLRRLCDTDLVSVMTAGSVGEVEAAFAVFTTLEGSGRKGRRGTSLNRSQAIHDFARAAVMQLAHKGMAKIDLMRVGDRPVAALIRFESFRLSIPWKIAFDEEFAAFSPGKQLICDDTRRWLADPTITRVDPVCEEGNPLIAGLWCDAEPYGTLLISTGRWGLAARLRADLINVREAGKKHTRVLLGHRRPKPRSRGKQADSGKRPRR